MKQRTTNNLQAGESYISNNSASTFRDCCFKFDATYRQKIKPIHKSVTLYFGEAIHATLDYAYTQAFDEDLCKDYFEAHFMGNLNEQPIMWAGDGKVKILKNGTESKARNDFGNAESACEYGKKMIERYIDRWRDDYMGMKVLASEVEFNFNLDLKENSENISYNGIIDKIVEIDGKQYVLDHKTAAQAMSQDLMQVENQISGYIIGARELGFNPVGAIFDVLYKKKEPEFEMIYVTRSEEQLKDFLDNTKETVKAIRAGYKFQNIGRSCKMCHLHKYCFAGKQLGELYIQASDIKESEDEEE
jgi:hypothetical protein